MKVEEELPLFKGKKSLLPHPIPLTPIIAGPLTFFPQLDIVAGADGKVSCELSSGITQQTNLTAGIHYLNGNWSPISEYGNNFNFIPPTLSASAEVKGYVGPELAVMLYGMIGPYVNVYGYSKIKAEPDAIILPQKVYWTLYGGLEAGGGVKADIFGCLKFDYNNPTIIYCQVPLVSGTITLNNPPAITSLTANPSTVNSSSSSIVTCIASDPDEDTLSYAWTKTGGTIIGTGTQVKWTAPSSSGTYYTITCAVSDGKGGTATKSVNVTVTAITNNSPAITSLTANPSTVNSGSSSIVTCIASDPDEDTLSYVWTKTGGTITGTGSQVKWTAPSSSGTYTITCVVSDGKGGTASKSVIVAITQPTGHYIGKLYGGGIIFYIRGWWAAWFNSCYN